MMGKWNFNSFPIWSKPASIVGGAQPAGDEVEVSRKDGNCFSVFRAIWKPNVNLPQAEPVTSPANQGQTQISERQDSTSLEILKSIVYGGLMEVIASLSIVASAAAANATTSKSNE
ncbi:hypothetical protein L1887_29401 [Cichorium endivia]|nr:hypothetical protein L1887_29401 [Cichorium endivia]